MTVRRKYNVHSALFTKVSQKRINESQIPAKSVSKENKTPQLNKTKEIENNIFTHCLAFWIHVLTTHPNSRWQIQIKFGDKISKFKQKSKQLNKTVEIFSWMFYPTATINLKSESLITVWICLPFPHKTRNKIIQK